jgi:MFS transporter, ACS family, glucarate transporter
MDREDRSGSTGSHARARRVLLGFAFTLAVVTYLDRVCISSAASFIRQDLHLTVWQMGLVFSAFTLAYAIFEVPSGWLGDVFGARSVLTRIVGWWSAFTVLTATAGGFRSLLVIRFLFGAGEAGAFPNISRAFSRWLPTSERGKANGVLFLGSRLGGALAPPLTALLIRHWGWRASFLTYGMLGVIWAVAWYRWFRDDPAKHPGVSPAELTQIQRDVVATPAREHARAVPWRCILFHRNILLICGMYFSFGYGLYFYFTWLPTYLTDALGFSSLASGFLAALPFLFAGAADIFGGWLTDWLARHFGLRPARSFLGFAAFGGSALLLLASVATSSRSVKVTLIALALGSADLALSACWAVCLDVGSEYAGVVTGCMNTFGNLGGFAGPVVAGYVVSRWNSWSLPFLISAALYASGAVLWLAIDPGKRIVQAAPPSVSRVRAPEL